MSQYFVIRGSNGKPTLSGEIAVLGAKNAALKAIAASILFDGPIRMENVPDIEDVSRMLDIIRTMGGTAEHGRDAHHVLVDARGIMTETLTPEIAKRLRASIVLTGPLLARRGRVRFPFPGGCVIGERPVDLFVESFEKMGATVRRSGKFFDVRAKKGKLHGAELFFRTQSVTGTETFLMAGVLATGKTVIKNAAMEPEIVWLADILNASGAHITGAGTPTITIIGGKPLKQKGSKAFRVVPDRIEAGSFLVLGALAAKELTVTNIIPEHLESLIETLGYMGVAIERRSNSLTVRASGRAKKLLPIVLKTHEYPGFPTDLQAPMTVLLTRAAGESMVFETIFEGRLNYTESLGRMGANVTMMDQHRVLIKGPTRLSGKRMESPDLRAGLAFVIAAIVASGNSEIHNIYNIDRGYERIEERLRTIGARIERVEA